MPLKDNIHKKIDGKIFTSDITTSQEHANKLAKEIRSYGLNYVRVVKERSGYTVYIRAKE